MAIFPQFNLSNNNTQSNNNSNSELGRVFLFDFKENNFVLKDGKMIEANYEQKIKMWIEQLIRTDFNKFKICKDTPFGIEIVNILGRRDISLGVVNSEIKRQIEEKIVLHPHISGVQNFSTERLNNEIIIKFDVILIDGNLMNQEVTISA